MSEQGEAEREAELPRTLTGSEEASLSMWRRIAGRRRPRIVRNAWFALRFWLGSYRLTYPLLRWAPAPYARVMVEPGMDACIDGLPRSANTFGGIVFLEQNPGVVLAHHMHLPAQFVKAVRVGVPCCVLIRRPVDNLASMAIAADNDVSHSILYWVYMRYLGQIEAVREQVALCTFDQVLADPSVIARRLNAKFWTSFHAEPMAAEGQSQIVAALGGDERVRPGHVPVPTSFKEDLKPRVKRALADNPRLPAAEALYARLAATAE